MDSISKNVLCIIFFIQTIHKAYSFLLLPLLGASLYQAYLEQGIYFRENIFLGNKPILNEYDFIIIGAGPGGCVVANRLSENPNWKVLLLEAGEDENIYTDIPLAVGYFQFSNFNWAYRVERNENACLATTDQRCPWPRGKGLGGSSIINYMIYTRGHRKDYDNYAAAGNTGWSYKDVLPYFLKSENNSIPEYQNSSYHAHDGNLHVERVRYKSLLVDPYLKAGEELGYKIIDYTEPTQIGVSRIQATTRRGRRVSASKAYLKTIKFRQNLHVSIQTRVTKILIDPNTKQAYGVEFVKNGHKRVVFARKEVICSAGPLISPQLLMLSGVGPKEHLTQLGIPIIQDLRVGENLQEHYTAPIMAFIVNQTGATFLEKRLNLKLFLDWLNNGRGPLTIPGGAEGIGYISTKYNTDRDKTDNRPDVELIFLDASLGSDEGHNLRKTVGITDCYQEENFSNLYDKETFTILPMLLHPKTRGKILLRDKNPWHVPKFYYNYFENPLDLKVMVEGFKEILRFSETKAFQQFGTILNPARIPQCSQHTFKSDAYFGCMARYFTQTLHHQCGTCKMGPRTDRTAVVDPQLRVYGIKNLRVVDSSIFPDVPGAHLYVPTLMVGEKAADMIKLAWLNEDNKNEPTQSPAELYAYTGTAPCFENINRTLDSNAI